MEYEPDILVPDIDNHVFTNEDGVNDDGMDDEEQEMTMEIGGLMMRPCLMDRERQDRVKSMKHDLMLASIPDEQENVEESE